MKWVWWMKWENWPASDTYKFFLHFILQAFIEIVKYECTGQILEDKFKFTFKYLLHFAAVDWPL